MNIVSLFSGCGGLDLGFRNAGFNIIWANEYDKSIHKTYRLNHPNTILNTADIRTLTGNDIPDCDGIIGGPPCQSWSEGGKGLGLEDPRGKLFLDYIRIVETKKPKFFVIENVQGILDSKHKKSLDSFLRMLCKIGYNVTYELLNSADYKIPQDRYRVFFVGIRSDLKNKFHYPNATSINPITLQQAIGDIIEKPRYYQDEQVKNEHPTRLNHDVYVGEYDNKFMSRNRVRNWKETSFTIQAQARNNPIHPQAPKMKYISPSKRIFAKGYEHLYRRLSVRECARIQTFPDNFKFFYNNIQDGYKMVGNAVPPRLAWYLAIEIKKAFTNTMQLSKKEKEELLDKGEKIKVSNIEINPDYFVNNLITQNTITKSYLNKNVLICLVKQDNIKHYINKSAKIYYTGKYFPSTIQIDKLYYFMPYIKGKGIRDLYIIKKARIGTKHEVIPECQDKELRLVFEIEYIQQLFNEYIPIHLNIWHTFTDTTINSLLEIKNNE